ncbi:hypothetical protein COCC4DRAFT_181242 [Bipolaris maydis ATCC 48331]|uniref:Uncharacterized protein n=2 Tax=Cochliobolus heterostrophus TaxID=5016 RepID=M2SII8_COCH5|nr:uncharacterized protein COCC4DRAFT_181242 [Bipolaris maydis ATCC 48331]EMD85180.1 hypothetical protein COCHEDRAFT_1199074 [Bipolaris maydis C5]KAJ5026949.1 hypothetical protein J3E73DRAFT_381814 [Bipolaris maydis]ENH99361.1 hypothetical protein COCC4DRAFT_181242 [Bipolaris maydis ATCC 48331]KAJ5059308.1 hypothetical protein J3E74DRAFT_418817 [Bipolaris maydis]KAJ6197718.1 hypothetical protein J3E72DRAFT_431492 [Bipolaris maydis]
MVLRLFVPEGEDQHPLVRRRPGGLAAQHDLITSPWRASLAAAGFTGFTALVGRSRPGIFLRSAAFFSVVDLSWTAAGLYGQREINRGVFKMENIAPEPGKLWQRTTRWTAEDATLAGGALGVVTALNPRAFPGAYGISRYIGAVTVGCALGYKASETFLTRIHSQMMGFIESSEEVIRTREYEKLQSDKEAKASLSFIGKLAFKCHTSPYLQILQNPLQFTGVGGTGGIRSRQQHAKPLSRESQGPTLSSSLQADTAKFTLMQIEFKADDLTGPDLEAGYRAYKDSLQTRDESAILEWREKIQKHKKQAGVEMQFVWEHLADREKEFYLHVEEDREKDILRRELQLLNNMAGDMSIRHAILEYHEADADKQLRQKRQADHVQPPFIESDRSQKLAAAAQYDYQGPIMVTEQVRTNWIRQKEVLHHLEHALLQYESIQPADGSRVFEHLKQIRQNAEELKRNVEATERLLRWFEVQVQQAEDKTKRET